MIDLTVTAKMSASASTSARVKQSLTVAYSKERDRKCGTQP